MALIKRHLHCRLCREASSRILHIMSNHSNTYPYKHAARCSASVGKRRTEIGRSYIRNDEFSCLHMKRGLKANCNGRYILEVSLSKSNQGLYAKSTVRAEVGQLELRT